MPILVLGLSHHTAPVTLREQFAFAEAKIPAALRLMKEDQLVEEAVILSTCNRVELYVVTSTPAQDAFPALLSFLVKCQEFRDPIRDEVYQLDEPASLEHLFKVASGLDSMILGETEILGQLKKAYDLALSHQATGRHLNRAFQKAFNVAKHIRTHTNIQRGSVSVGSVAVELAQKIFTDLGDRQVMVIGAGDTSEKTARALLSRGARSIMVSNRSFDRAARLATELGGRAVRFVDWPRECAQVDIVISSTSAPHHVLDRKKLEPIMKQRHHEPMLLIDIAVPRDIDPEVNYLENVYLYNIDDLQAIADDYLRQRQDEIDRCEQIIVERARSLLGSGPPPGASAPPQPAFGHE